MKEILSEKNRCFGCAACKNACPQSAIVMLADEEGFLYPSIEQSLCIDCGRCTVVCPMVNNKHYFKSLAAYAAKHKSDKVLKASSSGGMFTALSDEILSKGGAVYGAERGEGLITKHTRAVTLKQRNAQRGSKYVQSIIGDIYKQVENDLLIGRAVMFLGTPCQVDGLNHYLPKNLNVTGLLTVDVVCHGVPSPSLYADYIKYIEKIKKMKIILHDNRSKDLGWCHQEKFVYEDSSSEVNTVLSRTWRNIFYSGKAHRPICYDCPYSNLARPSDITIADYWGIEIAHPDFNKNGGVSLVLLNSEKGIVAFDRILDKLDFTESTLEKATIKQPRLRSDVVKRDGREEFWRNYQKKGMKYIIKRYGKYDLLHRGKEFIKKYFID